MSDINNSVSIIIPARNEQGNIEKLVQRIPVFPCNYEIIFVEGHSSDGTYNEIERVAKQYENQVKIKYIKQSGIGKANAVWEGFNLATNNILMILDADISVMPEDLSKFYEKINQNPEAVVYGSRLIFKMEPNAMRPINYLGNKFFASCLSLTCRHKFTDVLCGTKVMSKVNFNKIKNSNFFNKIEDPFSDFTLLLGAYQNNMPFVEVPVFYRSRTYGKTQISRFSDGFKLLKIIIKYLFYFRE